MLQQHLQHEHSIKKKHGYSCDLCGADFPRPERLKRHLEKKHKRSIKWQLNCPVCHRGFPGKKSYDTHIKCRHKNRKRGQELESQGTHITASQYLDNQNIQVNVNQQQQFTIENDRMCQPVHVDGVYNAVQNKFGVASNILYSQQQDSKALQNPIVYNPEDGKLVPAAPLYEPLPEGGEMCGASAVQGNTAESNKLYQIQTPQQEERGKLYLQLALDQQNGRNYSSGDNNEAYKSSTVNSQEAYQQQDYRGQQMEPQQQYNTGNVNNGDKPTANVEWFMQALPSAQHVQLDPNTAQQQQQFSPPVVPAQQQMQQIIMGQKALEGFNPNATLHIDGGTVDLQHAMASGQILTNVLQQQLSNNQSEEGGHQLEQATTRIGTEYIQPVDLEQPQVLVVQPSNQFQSPEKGGNPIGIDQGTDDKHTRVVKRSNSKGVKSGKSTDLLPLRPKTAGMTPSKQQMQHSKLGEGKVFLKSYNTVQSQSGEKSEVETARNSSEQSMHHIGAADISRVVSQNKQDTWTVPVMSLPGHKLATLPPELDSMIRQYLQNRQPVGRATTVVSEANTLPYLAVSAIDNRTSSKAVVTQPSQGTLLEAALTGQLTSDVTDQRIAGQRSSFPENAGQQQSPSKELLNPSFSGQQTVPCQPSGGFKVLEQPKVVTGVTDLYKANDNSHSESNNIWQQQQQPASVLLPPSNLKDNHQQLLVDAQGKESFILSFGSPTANYSQAAGILFEKQGTFVSEQVKSSLLMQQQWKESETPGAGQMQGEHTLSIQGASQERRNSDRAEESAHVNKQQAVVVTTSMSPTKVSEFPAVSHNSTTPTKAGFILAASLPETVELSTTKGGPSYVMSRQTFQEFLNASKQQQALQINQQQSQNSGTNDTAFVYSQQPESIQATTVSVSQPHTLFTLSTGTFTSAPEVVGGNPQPGGAHQVFSAAGLSSQPAYFLSGATMTISTTQSQQQPL